MAVDDDLWGRYYCDWAVFLGEGISGNASIGVGDRFMLQSDRGNDICLLDFGRIPQLRTAPREYGIALWTHHQPNQT